MNLLFGTKFRVLDASETIGRTTRGVWLGIASDTSSGTIYPILFLQHFFFILFCFVCPFTLSLYFHLLSLKTPCLYPPPVHTSRATPHVQAASPCSTSRGRTAQNAKTTSTSSGNQICSLSPSLPSSS